ncbi:DUF418 domain-containing protein [Nonomuraea rubra]|uniref:DUF418 domain-containing protein n=1 Tax=Nonomuraea rubra TaxID=46180 RepID=UPI00360E656C
MTEVRTPPASRVHEVDVVRGFALAGILVANIGYFADPGYAVNGTMPIPDGPVASVITALVLTKFYIIFSFLFGYSFTLQLRSAERAGASVRARTLRRCLGLFVIGVAHGILLWIGDILTLYAVLGLLLLAMRGMRPRTAVVTGSVIVGVLALLWAGLAALSTLDPAAGQALRPTRRPRPARWPWPRAARSTSSPCNWSSTRRSPRWSGPSRGRWRWPCSCSGWRRAGPGCWRRPGGGGTWRRGSSGSGSGSGCRAGCCSR